MGKTIELTYSNTPASKTAMEADITTVNLLDLISTELLFQILQKDQLLYELKSDLKLLQQQLLHCTKKATQVSVRERKVKCRRKHEDIINTIQ